MCSAAASSTSPSSYDDGPELSTSTQDVRDLAANYSPSFAELANSSNHHHDHSHDHNHNHNHNHNRNHNNHDHDSSHGNNTNNSSSHSETRANGTHQTGDVLANGHDLNILSSSPDGMSRSSSLSSLVITDFSSDDPDKPYQSSSESDSVVLYLEQMTPHIKYLGEESMLRIQEALVVAYEAHNGQKRKSGEPFITHPVAVAILLAELGMDTDTIIAGLLHDTVEDTDVTFEFVEEKFGFAVRRIVEGETKVSKLPQMADIMIADEQAENLRQMFIAMTEDWRIIVVKLCDRLHNMRTLQFMPDQKRKKISRETLDIFAPLAHRLGIWNIKSELEELSFKYLYPNEYREVEQLVQEKLPKYQKIMVDSQQALEKALAKDIILSKAAKSITVTGRIKDLYSIWRKMQQGHKTVEQIFDLVALRVIVEPIESKSDSANVSSSATTTAPPRRLSDLPARSGRIRSTSQQQLQERSLKSSSDSTLCYYILGVVHSIWQPFPSRVKDYCSFPKQNGYQSLHTTVMAGGAQAPLEVQIRTLEMHRVAEYGMASHWLFKVGRDSSLKQDGDLSPEANAFSSGWLNTIREWQDEIQSSREFVEVVRKEILGNRVFIFVCDDTESGSKRIMNLPRGSTVVDAAIYMGNPVALSMIAARINGKMVPMNTVLSNADVFSVVRSKHSPGPEPEWIDYATTRLAKTRLKLYFREQQRKKRIDQGYQILLEYLQLECSMNALDRKELEGYLYTTCGFQSYDDLFLKLARATQEEKEQIFDTIGKSFQCSITPLQHYGTMQNLQQVAPKLAIKGESERKIILENVQLATCCHPVYGDDVCILSVSNKDRPTMVHRSTCHYTSRMKEKHAGLIQELEWLPDDRCTPVSNGNSVYYNETTSADKTEDHDKGEDDDDSIGVSPEEVTAKSIKCSHFYRSCIGVTCFDRKGLLADVSAAVNRLKIFIEGTESITGADNIAYLEYKIRVQDLGQLNSVMQLIAEIPSVIRVERVGSKKRNTEDEFDILEEEGGRAVIAFQGKREEI